MYHKFYLLKRHFPSVLKLSERTNISFSKIKFYWRIVDFFQIAPNLKLTILCVHLFWWTSNRVLKGGVGVGVAKFMWKLTVEQKDPLASPAIYNYLTNYV